MHPYVNLLATINNEHNRAHGQSGVIVGVVNNIATVLMSDGSHVESHLSGLVLVERDEAIARLAPPDAIECYAYHAELRTPPDSTLDGYVPMGPWEPVGNVYMHPTGYTMRDWKRPLRRIGGAS